MMRLIRPLFCLVCLVLAGNVVAQDKMVSIYLEPEESGTVYFKESMNYLDDLDPRPLLDGSGAGKGWMFVLYPGKYVGYVSRQDIGPGPSVRDGAKAFLRPDESSPQLAVILDGDVAEVAREEGEWAVVYFQGQAPAYFRSEAQGGAVSVSSMPAPQPTQQAAQTPPPAPQSAPASQTPAAAASAAPVLEEVVMQEAPMPTSVAPSSPRVPAQTVERYVQGTIKPVTAWDRLFGTEYKYRLVDANDETMAYLLLDDVILFGPIEGYWNKRVEVTGVVRRISGSIP
ncbi:MAG: hypothetical protein ACQKBV_06185, partial [Puniceicoccales bacterium]